VRQLTRLGPLTPARAALISLLWIPAASAADLTVNVVGLKNAKGDVHIALFDKPDHFPHQEGVISGEEVAIVKMQAKTVFRDLSPGRYAIAVYHDENANHEFDQGFLGIPLEDFGFSDGARAFLGPPSFDEADIILPKNGSSTVIDLGN
jgi:uncharacterized protein (DUF2141 family)